MPQLKQKTHLNKDETINIEGYTWLGNPRKDRAGGGVGLLIRNDIANLTETIDN